MAGEAQQGYWEGIWSKGVGKGEAWDAAQVEPALVDLMTRLELPKGRALVPGCGRGYSLVQLAAADRSVLGLDLAPTGVAAAQEYLKATLGGTALEKQASVKEGDFFTLEADSEGGHFDLIYDCTFLCAIPKELREKWAEQHNKLLAPDGELVTLIFPVGPLSQDGPPFTINEDLVRSLLEPYGFKALSIDEVPKEHLARAGKGKPPLFEKEVIARWARA
eukprot:TRINITY_DN47332_c0_g1_i1.p1 TRINITY_DN47332_c0_g1~~TRINITY_DN47332_c0_g1_i1.p1  ORF type:complete len:220 (+),score=44.65 TRINITY_DN47332_c0_g1_i1:85-744(+)